MRLMGVYQTGLALGVTWMFCLMGSYIIMGSKW